ncbi:MAG TPA: HAD-IA family hydrolase [Polyangiaceae bacterium]|nr:HAD-IA family hydrolase [Polyangiaceae bacterium]
MANRAAKAVLCDVDGVLRLWGDGMERLDRAYGLPEGTLASAAFAPGRLLPAIRGRVSDEAWRAAVAADLAPACGSAERAAALVAAWSTPRGEVDRVVLGLLTRARGRARVVLVSNATTRLEDDLAVLGVLGAVDAVVNSARVGLVKPEPELYRLAAAIAGVCPEECLFVDDALENVEAAHGVGMVGVHYRGHADLRDALLGG